MSTIKGLIEEFENLESEIKRNNTRNKILRKRGNELKEQIKKYLQEKEQPGVKYRDVAIVLESKEQRKVKPKKDKERSAIEYLQTIGVENPEKAYQELVEVQKRSPQTKQEIKLKKLDKVKKIKDTSI